MTQKIMTGIPQSIHDKKMKDIQDVQTALHHTEAEADKRAVNFKNPTIPERKMRIPLSMILI